MFFLLPLFISVVRIRVRARNGRELQVLIFAPFNHTKSGIANYFSFTRPIFFARYSKILNDINIASKDASISPVPGHKRVVRSSAIRPIIADCGEMSNRFDICCKKSYDL